MAGEPSRVANKPGSGRTAASCDRCRRRKTKCNKPDPEGACDSCRSTRQVCSSTSKRRQKPFYFVAEEEYRLLQQICGHFFPDEDVSSVANLRRLASQCGKTGSATPESSISTPGSVRPLTVGFRTTEERATPEAGREDVVLQEIVDLHRDLGCRYTDSRGEYRYVGAESGFSFNTAVRSWVLNMPLQTHEIPLMLKVVMPVAKSRLSPDSDLPERSELPPRDILLASWSRYFEEVDSMYWLFSSEDFHTRVDVSYSGGQVQRTNSWLCVLHSMVALGAPPGRPGQPSPAEESRNQEWVRSSLDAAKLLVSSVCDEADLDSVRALMLLSLALQSNGYLNSAYLHIGMASRIAFSLGLHLDKYSAKGSAVAEASARRIWWSLFLCDHDMSLQLGKPCMSGPSNVFSWQPPLPSEEIVTAGPHTPHEHLKHCVRLARLAQGIRHTLYYEPIEEGRRLIRSSFQDALESLRQWLHEVPPHLHITSSLPPLHRRPVGLLHLRYWSTVILVTRPFLLCRLLRRQELEDTSKQQYFDGLARTCVAAAEASVDILEDMVRESAVSSLVTVDFFLALQVVQVILVASALYSREKYRGLARRCVSILKGIGTFGSPKHLLPETLYELQMLGLLNDERESCPAEALPRGPQDTLIGLSHELTSNEDHNRWFLSDFDFFDITGEAEFMDQLMHMPDSSAAS